MIEIRHTDKYSDWFDRLRDRKGSSTYRHSHPSIIYGQPWRCKKPVGEGVSELKIDYGPGYRVYFVQRGQDLIILLAGGDKRTQDKDIKLAIELSRKV